MTTTTVACTDWRCTDGITMCSGCNGYGVLRRNGKKFTLRGKGRHITEAHQPHDACSGTGLAACGCTPLDATAAATLTGTQQDDPHADAWAAHAPSLNLSLA
jgi:hypothetical protein